MITGPAVRTARDSGWPIGLAAALLAAALLLCIAALSSMRAVDPVDVDLTQARVEFTAARSAADGIRFALNSRGAALVRVPVEAAELAAYPMLEIELTAAPAGSRIMFFGRTGDGGAERALATVAVDGAGMRRSYVAERPEWSGAVRELILGIEGPAGAEFGLRALTLMSPGPFAVLANLWHAWGRTEPRSHDSVNVGRGPSEGAYMQPGVTLSLVAALGILLALLPAFARGGRRQALSAAGAVVLLCWLAADFLWLPQQLATAQQAISTYWGRTNEQRLLAGPDARLVLLSRRVELALREQRDLRIFVTSASDYRGMRAAYHLFPRNVFWQRDHELPPASHFRSGDYILLLAPSKHRVQEGRLGSSDPAFGELSVATVLVDKGAVLLRVIQ